MNHKTEKTVKSQRRIQDTADTQDKQHKASADKKSQAAPTGSRPHPKNPLPEQHLEKPGLESNVDPAPQYMAPDYQGSHKLQNKVALITGADSGIGRAVAVLYAREGADIAILYLSEDSDAKETQQAVENEGQRGLLIQGDVKDYSFCQAAVEKVITEFGQLDILVNNAAFQSHAYSLEDISEDHFDQTLKTNVYGYFHMIKATLPHLKPGSAIINTGSVTGLHGQPVLLDYSATKGAIHALTKALASNLVKSGIRVNAVAPGPVWTPLNPADQPAEHIKKFGKSTGMQRPAQPEELSPAYVFLAAPVCSSYITGIVLPVLGG